MLNTAILMGRLTADPELKTTQSGLSVTSFCVAVDRRYQKDGEKQADFINVVAWRQIAEFICKYFKKGQMIAVQGSIQTRNYEDKNGNKRTAVEIVADNVSFCGSKSESDEQNPQNASRPSVNTTNDDFTPLHTDDGFPFDDDDDGLPF